MDGYQHYIRTDASAVVIHSFSSAFEQPLETDILYEEDAGRHFYIPLLNERGQYKYKLVNVEIVERTQVELDTEWNSRPPAPPTELELLRLEQAQANTELIQLIIVMTGGMF